MKRSLSSSEAAGLASKTDTTPRDVLQAAMDFAQAEERTDYAGEEILPAQEEILELVARGLLPDPEAQADRERKRRAYERAHQIRVSQALGHLKQKETPLPTAEAFPVGSVWLDRKGMHRQVVDARWDRVKWMRPGTNPRKRGRVIECEIREWTKVIVRAVES
jgi:hypothetical protein